MSTTDSRFLLLPAELRGQIYLDYLTIGAEGGYVFDFASGKLRTGGGQPIGLSLMYTCKLIAYEMRGLALSTQTVTFRTVYSEELQRTAGRFHSLLGEISYHLKSAFWYVGGRMDVGDMQKIIRCYPPVSSTLREFVGSADGVVNSQLGLAFVASGEAPSLFLDILRHSLRHMAARPVDARCWLRPDQIIGYSAAQHAAPVRSPLHPDEISDRLSPWLDPWTIPTEHDLDRLYELVLVSRDKKDLHKSAHRKYWVNDVGKHRFSAAAAAIHFLRSMPGTRLHLRRIVLDEDYEAVAQPESHGRGLIPFCRENPLLRIERRANLWRNVLQRASTHHEDPWQDRVRNTASWLEHGTEGFYKTEITPPIARWIVEVEFLGSAGMPQNPSPFTLVLDGDPAPELATVIFRDFVQRDAAWQAAMEKHIALTPQHLEDFRRCSFFSFAGFPELLGDLSKRKPSSNIRCTFDPGRPSGVAAILERNKNLNYCQWDSNWEDEKGDSTYVTAPPLPSWLDLVLENVVVPLEEIRRLADSEEDD